jgi:hypothetical protein
VTKIRVWIVSKTFCLICVLSCWLIFVSRTSVFLGLMLSCVCARAVLRLAFLCKVRDLTLAIETLTGEEASLISPR